MLENVIRRVRGLLLSGDNVVPEAWPAGSFRFMVRSNNQVGWGLLVLVESLIAITVLCFVICQSRIGICPGPQDVMEHSEVEQYAECLWYAARGDEKL